MLQVPTTSSVKYSAILNLLIKLSLVFCLLEKSIYAKEFFEFSSGQKVSVLSEKAFRKADGNEFEAVGNVVITHLNSSIYGEKATVNFSKGITEVEGNVRYVAPELNMYGSKMVYSFQNQTVDLVNARIQTENFAVVGKKISQLRRNFIYAEDAEYSTCKDCPESWSILGKYVEITVGEYVRLKHAFIKVNGVVVMYVPYIIFPIKKERETGLLFPSFGLNYSEGVRFQQPFYWAISDFNDMTITPSVFGKRGFGNEFQFRQSLGARSWLHVDSLQLNDEIYLPYKKDKDETGSKVFRDYSTYEHHFELGKNIHHHFYFDRMKDLDVVRDLDFYTKDKILGTESGYSGFIEGRNQYFVLNAKAGYKRNFFFNDPKQFDQSYVQMLPKIQLSSVPFTVFSTDYLFMRKLNLVFNSDYTVFKQNNVIDNGFIRNANRFNLTPYLDWQFGRLGPVRFSTKIQLDEQHYWLNTSGNKKFSKTGVVYESEAKIEFEKIFGISYEKEVPADSLKIPENDETSIIGSLPSIRGDTEGTAKVKLPVNSYRHSQEVKLKHYYLSDQKTKGNESFKKQIEADNGQFDYVDALREKEFENNQISARDSLPLSNTIEFQWNHILVKKTPNRLNAIQDGKFLKDNFSYSKISFFDVSQGIDMNRENVTFHERLTRLYIHSGLSVNNYSLDLKEFYFHQTSEHKFSLSFAKAFERLSLGTEFNYNSFNSSTTPILKTVAFSAGLNINDLIHLTTYHDYNMRLKKLSKSSYGVLYTPLNNCWRLEVNYATDLIDKRIGFNLLINYNDNSFQGLNR